ncbi:nucleotidyltransferase family protein [Streptomyces sp. Agncl-13]|uniref:nucleotidyltransferase domain-containing protein n=1 Tax=Streptomyces sp. Agncl-13 TaxID=3400628 RepID=UPI003A88ED95
MATTSLPERAEFRLLLALSRPSLTVDEVTEVKQLIDSVGEDLDWGLFIERALRHKVFPLVGHHIITYRLFQGDGRTRRIPHPQIFESGHVANRERNAGLFEEFGQVIRCFESSGLRYAVRKGPLIAEHLYRNPALRPMSDLDLLIDRTDAMAAGELLGALGYAQGWVDTDGQEVKEFSRRTRAYWRLNLKNELPYVKITHRDFIESFNVDVCLDIFQSSGAAVTTAELLDRRIEVSVCGTTGSALAPPDQFIDLCSHLHKEATSRYYIAAGFDLQILKFLDIALACRQLTEQGLWPAVRERARQYGAEAVVYYAMYYAAQLYPDYVPDAELAALCHVPLDYLDEYGAMDGEARRWQEPFWHRLFDIGRGKALRDTVQLPRT